MIRKKKPKMTSVNYWLKHERDADHRRGQWV
jgi:hypothetical protein